MNIQSNALADTVRGLFDDLSALVRQEFALAKAETGEKMEQVQTGLMSVLFGMLVGFCALIVLTQAVVVALSNVMPPSLAAALVGAVLGVIAYAAIRHGETNLKPKNLAPRRTMRSVSEQTQKIKEQL